VSAEAAWMTPAAMKSPLSNTRNEADCKSAMGHPDGLIANPRWVIPMA
jgi:hypothetical protein